jgi:hypothetical protein
LRNREVEVYFNYERPETVGVKILGAGEAFSVRRATLVPGMDASAEVLHQADEENASHEAYRKELYRTLQPVFSEHFMARPIFHQPLIDRATAEAGERIRAGAEEQRAEAKREIAVTQKAHHAAARAGLVLRDDKPRTDDQLQAIPEFARLVELALKQNPGQ